MSYEVILGSDFVKTERGNVLITHIEENWLNAFIELGDDCWIEISWRPCNYPSLTVQTTKVTPQVLADHINNEFNNGMWFANKVGSLAGLIHTEPDGMICEEVLDTEE